MAKQIVVGSLSTQNWHRQARRLPPQDRLDFFLEKTLRVQRRFGFRPMGLDFSLRHLPTSDAHYLAELRARLDEHGLIGGVGFGQIPTAYDPEARRETLVETLRNLEVVAQLGASLGFLHPAYHGRVTREGRIQACIEGLREIGAEAARLGITITQENYDYFTSHELARISGEVALPNVGVHSDTGNWLILGEDPLEATRVVLPYTLHAHVRDYALENHTYNGVALGEGLVDFDAVLPVLAQAPPERIIFSIEVDTDDRDEDQAAERSFAYLKAWLDTNHHLQTN